MRRQLAALAWAGAVLASALVGQRLTVAVMQSVVWLPTGVAIAGVWILGARRAWMVTLGIFLHRWVMGVELGSCLLAGLGTTAEALLGSWILRRCALDARFTRLLDVLVLFLAAAVAPLASVLFSLLTRQLDPDFVLEPFYSGWLGWWRMNALGALTLTPSILVWAERERGWPAPRAWLEGAALGGAAAALAWAVMSFSAPGITGVLALYALLPVALLAALRFGPRGAITIAATATLIVVAIGSLAGGPFLDVPVAERHAPLQLFGLTLIGIPLVIGSLIAERESRVRRTEQQLALQAGVLELVARGESYARVFDELVLGIEQLLQDGRCSILLLEGRRLRHASAPSLPAPYNQAIDGVEIGPTVGSCGTAAFTGRTVVVADIARDPLWKDFAALALAHELCACWSVPIRAAAGPVLGTFALYYSTARAPRPEEVAIVERAAALCALAIERERREEQFRQTQRMEAVGKLAGGVAHDFNNLLTVITGFAEAILLDLPAGSPAEREAAEILGAARRGAGLTRQLLSFSRQRVLTSEVLDLATVVANLGGMLERLIGEDVRLAMEHHGGLALVRADRGQLEQVLMNLVLNARDAMPQGGTVTIATALEEVGAARARTEPGLAPGSYVTLAVRDTGVGMSEDVRRRAFDPFFTTKEQGKGTGIGLSTVYGIVQHFGGSVWIESSPGHGTTVWIRLPEAPEPVRAETGVLVPRAPVRAATILVAEDEAGVREFVQATLTRAGHAVLAAENGRVALELARRHRGPIDLLVTDVVMPELGGPELARELHATRPDLPVLYVTGYASESSEPVSGVPGAVASLSKPFDSAHLLQGVADLLGAAAPAPGTALRTS